MNSFRPLRSLVLTFMLSLCFFRRLSSRTILNVPVLPVLDLACGLPAVTSVEYMPWLYPLFANPPKIEQGRLVPPPGPGLGLEIDTDAVAKHRVRF